MSKYNIKQIDTQDIIRNLLKFNKDHYITEIIVLAKDGACRRILLE